MPRHGLKLAGLLAASLVLPAMPARAADAQASNIASDAAILAARQGVDPGSCDLKPKDSLGFAIRRYKLPHQTLIEVPCRTTVNSVLSMFFSQSGGVLSPVPFAAAIVDYKHDSHNRIDWTKARISGFVGVAELPDVEVDTKAGIIDSRFRIAAGEADGDILSVYRLDDQSLARVEVHIDGKEAPVRTFVWPQTAPH